MFYLKIENAARLKPNDQPISGPNIQVVENDRLRISTATDNLYSFYFCSGPNIIVGESLIPLSIQQLQEEFRKFKDNESLFFSNEVIPVLVTINAENGEIRAYRNFSGNRPLYFYSDDDNFACASRPALLAKAGVKLKIGEGTLPELLVYRYVTPPATPFRGVKLLPTGWALTSRVGWKDHALRNMWPPVIENKSMTRAQAIDGIVMRLEQSLRDLIGLSGEAALLLSGGLDSSILGAICKRIGLKVKSYSSGFHAINGDRGEADYAKSSARALGLEHTVYDIDADTFLHSIVESISDASEPIHHLQSAVLRSLFRSVIPRDVRYLICGEGADSLVCNSTHHRYWRWKSVYGIVDKPPIKKLIGPVLRPLSSLNDKFSHFGTDHSIRPESVRHFIWEMGAFGDQDWISRRLKTSRNDIIARRKQLLSHYERLGLMDKITILSLLGEAETTMRVWSNLAEASGRVVMYPFQSPALISFVMSIPWELKAKEPKRLLKDVAEALGLPREVIERPKRSFGFPTKYWAGEGGLFQPLVDMAGKAFDREALKSLQGSDPARAMTLWGYINVYLWKRMFEDGDTLEAILGEMNQRRKQSRRKVGTHSKATIPAGTAKAPKVAAKR